MRHKVLLTLPPELDNALEVAARKNGESKSSLAEKLIRSSIEDVPDFGQTFFPEFLASVMAALQYAQEKGWISLKRYRATKHELFLTYRECFELLPRPILPPASTASAFPLDRSARGEVAADRLAHAACDEIERILERVGVCPARNNSELSRKAQKLRSRVSR